MKKRTKIIVFLSAIVIITSAFATYLFTIGPLGKPVLASVNGENILVAHFQEELGKLDSATRDLLREDPTKLLDHIVNRTLLLQQAKKEGISSPTEGTAKPQDAGQDKETAVIIAYLEKKLAALPPVSPTEIEQVYEAYKSQMGKMKKQDATAMIRQMIEQQRQGTEVEKLINELRKDGKIEINQRQLKKLAALPPGMETQSEADFRKALTGGKPMIVDFGSNSCIPCRQLRPVLQKIRKDFSGRIEVLIIDIRHHPKLADEYRVQVIPTVIFFDTAGKEVFRHQGFMGEEMVKKQLASMGMA